MRVLVADNDPEALDLAVLDLRLEGHVVVGVGSGSEVLRRMEEFDPDVLVVDYRMPPGPTGLDVAQSVRARWPDVHVVLYTNYQNAAIVQRANTLHVTFLPKGDLRSLRAVVSDRTRRQPGRLPGSVPPTRSVGRPPEPHQYA